MLNTRRNKRRSSAAPQRWQWAVQTWHVVGRRLSIFAATSLVLIAVSFGLLKILDQPIERIQVEGSFQHLTALDVEKAARAQLHGAGLLSVRLSVVSRGVRALPWVEAASVQRSWPRGLNVRVSEQQAVARWNDSDLVNAHGELFVSDARLMPPELPRLAGPAGTEAEVVARYLSLQGRITEAGMRLSALRLDARGAWELQLDNGVSVRFGRKQVDERVGRFIDVALRVIAQRAADIAYLDMRYTNGYAIGWRSGATRLADSHNVKENKPHG